MNVYVRELARELGQSGFEVDVFTRSQDPSIPRVVALGEGARVIHLEAGPARPVARAAQVEHLGAFAEGVETFRRAVGAEYALVHSHYWLSGLVGLELARRWDRPLIHMFHTVGAIKNQVARGSGDVEPPERLLAETRIAAGADRIVASNPVERADLVWHLQADPGRITIIPCGVDTELFRPGDAREARARLGIVGERILLFVGRLTPIKGVETLLRALALLASEAHPGDGVRLVVVGGERGETADAGHLRRLARELGVDERVDFRGPQPQDVLPHYYRAADLCLMPSRYESFGMVALEAMACGVPVVASRVGGLAVTIQDGVTGLLVPEGDSEALVAGVRRLLDDESRRKAMGAEAVECARRFGWPCIARQVAELYGELVPALRGATRPFERCQSIF
jgi:D-inositol-3-phosphate glycosyltransferase